MKLENCSTKHTSTVSGWIAHYYVCVVLIMLHRTTVIWEFFFPPTKCTSIMYIRGTKSTSLQTPQQCLGLWDPCNASPYHFNIYFLLTSFFFAVQPYQSQDRRPSFIGEAHNNSFSLSCYLLYVIAFLFIFSLSDGTWLTAVRSRLWRQRWLEGLLLITCRGRP